MRMRISNILMSRSSAIILGILFISISLIAQNARVEGIIIEKNNGTGLFGVNLTLALQSDTAKKYYTSTDKEGRFTFADVQRATYIFEVVYLGYASIRKTVTVERYLTDLGVLSMTERAIQLDGVLVEGRVPQAIQKGDTTEYNAKAFKVNKDATVEDLVTKMPGVTIVNGTVKAHGEEVQQVLVDGKQFFGTDPSVALKNLPSEIVDRIQVFDKLSDQAQFTGFDDGQSKKTMNIVTREDRRKGKFGRFNTGYGTDDRYTVGGTYNSFEDVRRFTLLGLSNNVNQQNFGMQDLFGVMGGGDRSGGGMRGGRPGGGRPGGGMGGGGRTGGSSPGTSSTQQSGISTVHTLGMNYADSIATGLFMNGSYFFNYTNNDNPKTLEREYTSSTDTTTYYNETSGTKNKNFNHRFDFRFEYAFDTSNTILFTPQLYVQDNRTTTTVTGTTLLSDTALLSRSQSDNTTTTDGYNGQSHFLYRHRFPLPGRTISIDVGVGGDHKNSSAQLHSLDEYVVSGINDTIDQRAKILVNGTSISSNLMYTEPLWTNSILRFGYTTSYSKNSSDKKTFDYDPLATDFTIFNDSLSNFYENSNILHSGSAEIGYRTKTFNAMAGVSYQIATLNGTQSFPTAFSLEKRFYSVLPSAMAWYNISRRQNIRLFYRTSTASPTVSQLQNVVDNSNSLLLTSGNPDLKQSYSQMVGVHYFQANTETAQNILLFLNVNATNNYIGNSSIIAMKDTILPSGIQLNNGTQLTIPVNLNGYRNVTTFCTYGFPFDLIRTNVNLNLGFNYTRTPGLVNSVPNASNLYAYSPGIVLGSNISENVDFTLSYTANYNRTKNSVRVQLDNNYYSHTVGIKFNAIFLGGFVFRNELNNTLYSGLGVGLDRNYILWNISIGKKLFANDRGELLLTVYDVLNQNRSQNRTVTETYVEDATTNVLKRYFMLTFTYNLRSFLGVMNDHPPPPPPGG
jgi:hypothetical protein